MVAVVWLRNHRLLKLRRQRGAQGRKGAQAAEKPRKHTASAS